MSDDAAAPVPPVRLSQTTYLTADIVGLSNFYAELFDLEEVEEFRSEVFRGLRLGDVMLGFSALEAYDLLDIGDRRDPTGTGQYLTFEMPDDEAVNERVKAAEALGATGEVVFLGHPDGELASSLTEREQVALWIRRLRPTVVLGHDPWKRYRLHPDHRHAGWLTTDGVVAARDPKFFPHQGVPHHRPDRLLLWEADAPDHVEDVTGWLDTKYAALLAHESQFETTMLEQTVEGTVGADSPEMAAFRARVEAKLTAAGDAAGVTHAEVFKLIDDL